MFFARISIGEHLAENSSFWVLKSRRVLEGIIGFFGQIIRVFSFYRILRQFFSQEIGWVLAKAVDFGKL